MPTNQPCFGIRHYRRRPGALSVWVTVFSLSLKAILALASMAKLTAHSQPSYMRKLILFVNHQPKETYVYKLTRCQSSVYRIPSYKIDRSRWIGSFVLRPPSVAWRSPCSGSHRLIFHSPQIRNSP